MIEKCMKVNSSLRNKVTSTQQVTPSPRPANHRAVDLISKNGTNSRDEMVV
jgi:hypothetical protein